MTAPTKTKWRIAGVEIGSCNCAWGCPCQFNDLPTHGNCEAFVGWEIKDGYYGDTRLDGVRYAWVLSWPGAVHEGNGTSQLIIDERATPAQREALVALCSGQQGGAVFEIYGAVTPNHLETLYAPIEFELDRTGRRADLRVPGVGETHIAPITNPVTGEEHTVRIVLPNGFEFKEADVANSVAWTAALGNARKLEHERTYGQLYSFEWSND
jgi:hypothetical protein